MESNLFRVIPACAGMTVICVFDKIPIGHENGIPLMQSSKSARMIFSRLTHSRPGEFTENYSGSRLNVSPHAETVT